MNQKSRLEYADELTRTLYDHQAAGGHVFYGGVYGIR